MAVYKVFIHASAVVTVRARTEEEAAAEASARMTDAAPDWEVTDMQALQWKEG